MTSFLRLHKRRLKRHLPRNQMRRCTAIRDRVMLSPAITGNTTTRPRLTSPTAGQATFLIANCGNCRTLRRQSRGATVAYIRKFGVCRICLRGLALKGEFPGVFEVVVVENR